MKDEILGATAPKKRKASREAALLNLAEAEKQLNLFGGKLFALGIPAIAPKVSGVVLAIASLREDLEKLPAK